MKFVWMFAFLGIMLEFKAGAQISAPVKDTSKIYTNADTAPQYPGGFAMYVRYIDNNSEKLLKPGHATGTVFADVVMEKNGQISQVKIIHGLTAETDSAAIYLLKNSPFWKSALKNGQPVRASGRLGVTFKNPMASTAQNVASSSGHNNDVTIDEPVGHNNTVGSELYTSVETPPEFPGGAEKFKQYIKDNRQIVNTVDNSRPVVLMMVVEKDGSITDIRVVRGIATDCDVEAIRLLKTSPKWKPGIQHGVPVRVQIPVPIWFKETN